MYEQCLKFTQTVVTINLFLWNFYNNNINLKRKKKITKSQVFFYLLIASSILL